MNVTITIPNEIVQHLNGLPLGQVDDISLKLQFLLKAEYRRQLTHYSLTNRQFVKKYNLSFEEFERQQITKQHGYSWEIESDAIVWETAFDGIRTMKRKLTELRTLKPVRRPQ